MSETELPDIELPDIKLPALLADALNGHGGPRGPGAAIGVVIDGRLRWTAAQGLANIEHGVEITTSTPFHVASVSKQFTAYCMARLVAARAVDYDAPVAQYLDWFPFPDITVRHLVHHTSGLRDQWAVAALRGWRWEDVITTEDINRLTADSLELQFTPGTRHVYSNTGYTILAEIVRSVTGETFRNHCRQTIFDPLGMRQTTFVDDHHLVIPGRADSYRHDEDGTLRRIQLAYSTVGATNLSTTVEDLARWAAHVMTPPVTDLLLTRGTLADGTLLDYACGVSVGRTDHGHVTFSHSGGDAGFHSYLYAVPSQRIAGIGMSNHSQFLPGEVVRAAVDRTLAVSRPAPADARPPSTSRHHKAASTAPPRQRPATDPAPGSNIATRSSTADIAGWYVSDAGTACEVNAQDGALSLRIAHITVALTETSPGVFRDGDGYGASIIPLADHQISLRATAFDPPQAYTRQPAATPGQRPPTGSYYSAELDTVVHVHRRAGVPLLRNGTWGDVELRAVAEHLYLARPPSYPFHSVVSLLFPADESGFVMGNPLTGGVRFTRIELPAGPRSVALGWT